jgi:hypothetical protein
MPERYYLPAEAFTVLKNEYDSVSLQDHWFFVQWGLGRGTGEEFVLPARTQHEACEIVQNRLRELSVNTSGSWHARELGLGPGWLSASGFPKGFVREDFWPPDIVKRAEAIKMETVESVRRALDNEIARFDYLRHRFEKVVATHRLK